MKIFKLLIFTTIFMLPFSISTAQIIISGLVYDIESKLPLANCNVISDSKKNGTFTDARGYFTRILEKNEKINFSIVGFTQKSIAETNKLLDTIFLTKKILTDYAVTVKPKILINTYELGNIGKSKNTSVTPFVYGSVYGKIIKNEKNTLNGYLSAINVKFEFSKNRLHSQLLRIHIYSLTDSNNILKNLLTEDFYYQLKSNQKKNINIDLESLNIKFPLNGIYIGIENIEKPVPDPNQYSPLMLIENSIIENKIEFKEYFNLNELLLHIKKSPKMKLKINEIK